MKRTHDRRTNPRRRPHETLRVREGREFVRLMDGEDVVSELPKAPQPLHDPFDVLAASVVALSPGSRVALLGFAAGTVVALMRLAGWRSTIDAVDLDERGLTVFRDATEGWGGDVRFHRVDAHAFLRARRARFDAIVEDLSCSGDEAITKPAVCLDALPSTIAARLAPGGLAITNLLPVEDVTMRRAALSVAAPHGAASRVIFEGWENQIVVAGSPAPDARTISTRLRRVLAEMGSRAGSGAHVRTLVRACPAGHAPSSSGHAS